MKSNEEELFGQFSTYPTRTLVRFLTLETCRSPNEQVYVSVLMQRYPEMTIEEIIAFVKLKY